MPFRSQPLRGAVIGYGFISSSGHVPAYVQRRKAKGDVDILAVADVCEARLEAARRALPEARMYADYRDLLEREAGNLDFVDICVPPSLHAEMAIEALSRGLHVLCEKPLAASPEDAQRMREAALRYERVLMPCHNYRYAPVIREVNAAISAGRIGKVRSVTLQTFRYTHARGVEEWNTHWRRDPALSGGGIAMDHGSHTFYLALDWMGTYPISITAKMSEFGVRADGNRWGTEDEFAATLTFPNGTAHAFLTWNAGVRKVIYTVQGAQGAIRVEDDDLEIARSSAKVGEVGSIRNPEWSVDRRRVSSDWMDAGHAGWFDPLFERFRLAVARGECAGRDLREALLCIELIDAAYRSARDGSREVAVWHKD